MTEEYNYKVIIEYIKRDGKGNGTEERKIAAKNLQDNERVHSKTVC